MSDNRVYDKNGERIREGDYVSTRYRGGFHEGVVCAADPPPELAF